MPVGPHNGAVGLEIACLRAGAHVHRGLDQPAHVRHHGDALPSELGRVQHPLVERGLPGQGHQGIVHHAGPQAVGHDVRAVGRAVLPNHGAHARDELFRHPSLHRGMGQSEGGPEKGVQGELPEEGPSVFVRLALHRPRYRSPDRRGQNHSGVGQDVSRVAPYLAEAILEDRVVADRPETQVLCLDLLGRQTIVRRIAAQLFQERHLPGLRPRRPAVRSHRLLPHPVDEEHVAARHDSPPISPRHALGLPPGMQAGYPPHGESASARTQEARGDGEAPPGRRRTGPGGRNSRRAGPCGPALLGGSRCAPGARSAGAGVRPPGSRCS